MVERDEPLLGRSEDDRLVVSLSIRVAVLVVGDLKKIADFLESVDHDGVAVFEIRSREFACFQREHAALINGVWDR